MSQRQVGTIIARDSYIACAPDVSVHNAAETMAGAQCGSILVMSGDALCGIFTERDLLVRVIAAHHDPHRMRVEAAMTHNPVTVASDLELAEAIRIMDEGGFRYLPVLESARVIGVLSARDLPYAEIGRMARELDKRHSLNERLW